MARPIDAALRRGHDVVGMGSGAVIPRRAFSRPPRLSAIACGELVKTARAETTSSPRCGCLRFASPAVSVLAHVLARRLAWASRLFSIRISPRPYDMRDGAIFPVAVVLSYSFLLVDDGVGERVFIADGVMLEAKGSENPNIVAVVVQGICGLIGVNLVVPIEVHRELLNDMTDGDTVAGHIAIADSDAVGLADENTIGFYEVKCFRESVVVVAHCSVLSAVPFRHL